MLLKSQPKRKMENYGSLHDRDAFAKNYGSLIGARTLLSCKLPFLYCKCVQLRTLHAMHFYFGMSVLCVLMCVAVNFGLLLSLVEQYEHMLLKFIMV